MILTAQQLGEDFFNLRTGLACELFQKCVNYRARLAIVIPDPGKYGQRFAELAYNIAAMRPCGFSPARKTRSAGYKLKYRRHDQGPANAPLP
ncbi:MAG: DUF4180 domain-containing protein [Gammaproteobacteria bacterium]|nr:DUF4180 domain-containing protein [Gammaproteobacteria bacterium]MDE2346603.1 DUF4180 domain-containing protein [Gammaproteobacteria bacterium]